MPRLTICPTSELLPAACWTRRGGEEGGPSWTGPGLEPSSGWEWGESRRPSPRAPRPPICGTPAPGTRPPRYADAETNRRRSAAWRPPGPTPPPPPPRSLSSGYSLRAGRARFCIHGVLSGFSGLSALTSASSGSLRSLPQRNGRAAAARTAHPGRPTAGPGT